MSYVASLSFLDLPLLAGHQRVLQMCPWMRDTESFCLCFWKSQEWPKPKWHWLPGYTQERHDFKILLPPCHLQKDSSPPYWFVLCEAINICRDSLIAVAKPKALSQSPRHFMEKRAVKPKRLCLLQRERTLSMFCPWDGREVLHCVVCL